MYLLDTNHCSFLIEGNTKVINQFQAKSDTIIATCAVVAGELRYMAQKSQQKTANLIKIQLFLRQIDIYAVDAQTAEIYGDFKVEIIKNFGPKEKRKRNNTTLLDIGISENDLWIVATALCHSMIVVSCDSDFARMRQVREFPLENWS
jgi:tRNA(fMet)-specific endonuclease VapC